MNPDAKVREEAVRWAALTGDAAFEDWEGFTLWLECDPAHARAYDEVMAAVADATDALRATEPPSASQPANDDLPGPIGRRRSQWFGPALAASLAGLAAVGLWQFRDNDETYATAVGETIEIALDEGSTIALAGGSRLVVEDGGERRARLERGQALFRIRHDEGDPFMLVAGGDTLVDAGTIFDVRLGRAGLEVGVAEGAVIVNPQTRKLRLGAGERLTRAGERYVVQPIAPAEVGEWAEGRITFRDAPLAEIASDLTRATGASFAADPGSGGVRLSGSIAFGPVAEDPRALESLLDVKVRRSNEIWVLSAD